MKIYTQKIKLSTKKRLEIIDITDNLNKILKSSKINSGIMNVYSRHTTLAIKINENEELLLKDISHMLEEKIPKDKEYSHDKLELRKNCPRNEPKNADSHLKCLFLETSQTIPIIESKLDFGKWQSVLIIETSGPRDREITIQIIGE